jgi:class 3 adenylate cyclase
MDGDDRQDLRDLGRLLLEDVCSDLVRFLHSGGDPARFAAVHIDREYALGPPGAFADLRVEPAGEAPYFLEVKYGYDAATLVAHLRRKYGAGAAGAPATARLVLVAEAEAHADWPAVEAAVRAAIPAAWALEVWDAGRLRALVRQCFGVEIPSFAPAELVAVRERIDEGKEALAFGARAPGGYGEAALRRNLLWHFGTWRLRELRHRRGDDPAALVPPGGYDHVVVLLADLSGFSRFVRDTGDQAVVRRSLTGFYAKARYQVINAGGMLAQFVGDEVVALFGLPDQRPGYREAALRTALRLRDIGASVAHDWQRQIDHVQPAGGVHVGLAAGRVQLFTMRPFDPAHLAVIGDCINLAQRLLASAGPGEIVVSNVLRHALRAAPYAFVERAPLEARNVGMVRPWCLAPLDDVPPPPA